MTEQYWALLPAAGVGQRMGATVPKQYLSLHGKPVLLHAVEAVLQHPRISGAVVVLSPEDGFWPTVAQDFRPTKPVWRAPGGAERAHSVRNGLHLLAEHADTLDWIVVHDAARPCLQQEDLDRLLAEVQDDPVGGLLAVPARDTLKQAHTDGRIAHTVDRSAIWHALTPQVFRLGALQSALEAALACGKPVTDEASAMEMAGFSPKLVEGRADNVKITRPEDLALAAFFLARRHDDVYR